MPTLTLFICSSIPSLAGVALDTGRGRSRSAAPQPGDALCSASLRVVYLLHAFAQQVYRQHQYEQRDAGDGAYPPGDEQDAAPVSDHRTPGGDARRDADPQEAE